MKREIIGEDNAALILAQAGSLVDGAETVFDMLVQQHGQPRFCHAALVCRRRVGGHQGYLLLADVSARKLAELALHDEKEKFRVTLNSIGDAVIATDGEGKVTFINPRGIFLEATSQSPSIEGDSHLAISGTHYAMMGQLKDVCRTHDGLLRRRSIRPGD